MQMRASSSMLGSPKYRDSIGFRHKTLSGDTKVPIFLLRIASFLTLEEVIIALWSESGIKTKSSLWNRWQRVQITVSSNFENALELQLSEPKPREQP